MVIEYAYTSYESMFVSIDFCCGCLHLVDAVISVLAGSARAARSQRILAELMYMQPCVIMIGLRSISFVTTSYFVQLPRSLTRPLS